MAQIKGKQIEAGSLAPSRIQDATAEGAVIVSQSDNSFTSAVLSGDLTITGGGVATIGNGKVSTVKIEANAITEALIADGAIQDEHLNAETFTFDAASGGSNAHITLSGDPTAQTDLASKGYVDNAISANSAGIAPKASVTYATAGNISFTYNSTAGTLEQTTATAPTSVYGTPSPAHIQVGDEILVWQQTNKEENGIYVVNRIGNNFDPTKLTRRSDADTGAELVAAYLFVREGTYAEQGFINVNDSAPDLASDDVGFERFSVSAVEAGNGVTVTQDAVAGAQVAVNAASNGGLEATQGTGSNELGIKLVASSGLETSASGLGVLSADDSLSLDGTGLKVNGDGETLGILSNQLLSAQPNRQNNVKQTTGTISGDGADTGLTISGTPAGGSNVAVLVNGVEITVGDGSTSGSACYFGTSSTSARAISAITNGDKLFWNATTAGYSLESSDIVAFRFNSLSV
jgi:hypothetical protein